MKHKLLIGALRWSTMIHKILIGAVILGAAFLASWLVAVIEAICR